MVQNIVVFKDGWHSTEKKKIDYSEDNPVDRLGEVCVLEGTMRRRRPRLREVCVLEGTLRRKYIYNAYNCIVKT